MWRYRVIEDNGGGLTLIVFGHHGEIAYVRSGYEHNRGALTRDIYALKAKSNPKYWEGNLVNGEDFDYWFPPEMDWEIVADNDGIYKDKMGISALKEFVYTAILPLKEA